MASDKYMSHHKCFVRLMEEYHKYGNLIVALDFDGTINDYHNEGLEFDRVIALIKACNELSFQVVIFTANPDTDYIEQKCSELGIEICGINKNLVPMFDKSKKIYYNILLDDRAGLESAFYILADVVTTIKEDQ